MKFWLLPWLIKSFPSTASHQASWPGQIYCWVCEAILTPMSSSSVIPIAQAWSSLVNPRKSQAQRIQTSQRLSFWETNRTFPTQQFLAFSLAICCTCLNFPYSLWITLHTKPPDTVCSGRKPALNTNRYLSCFVVVVVITKFYFLVDGNVCHVYYIKSQWLIQLLYIFNYFKFPLSYI